MKMNQSSDLMPGLDKKSRRQWRRMEQRALKDHDADQLATLRNLAETRSTVTGIAGTSGGVLTDSVEIFIEGRRLRAGRVYRPAVATLKEALGSIASVPLTAVGRYGPFWVLTFKLATEPLVVLVDRLTLLPEWGGTSTLFGPPASPLPQFA
jgi:hypothetical protein